MQLKKSKVCIGNTVHSCHGPNIPSHCSMQCPTPVSQDYNIRIQCSIYHVLLVSQQCVMKQYCAITSTSVTNTTTTTTTTTTTNCNTIWSLWVNTSIGQSQPRPFLQESNGVWGHNETRPLTLWSLLSAPRLMVGLHKGHLVREVPIIHNGFLPGQVHEEKWKTKGNRPNQDHVVNDC